MAAVAEGVKRRAGELGWTEELVSEFEQSQLSESTIRSLLALRVDADSARAFMKAAVENPAIAAMNFRWARPSTQLGVRARPGEHGLGMPEINIGTYGTVPDHWPYENDTPLGSHPTPGSYMPGPYSIFSKSEVWAEAPTRSTSRASANADPGRRHRLGALSEQPNQSSAPFARSPRRSLRTASRAKGHRSGRANRLRLPRHQDLLSVQNFDAGRKVEALRKRALANGGGLLQSNLGTLYRTWFGALKSTEWLTSVCVVYKVYEVATFEALAEACPSAVDRKLFSLLARDSRRHLEYGVGHLAYYLQYHPNAQEYLGHFIGRAEAALADEINHSPAVSEALAVLFAGGTEQLPVGISRLRDLRSAQLKRYLNLLDSVSFNRDSSVNPGLVDIARTGGLAVAAPQ